MIAFRVVSLIGLLLGFVILAAPLQWVARRRKWRLAQKIPIYFCRSICWALQVRPVFHGLQSPIRPQLVVVNHVSFVDILVLGCRDTQSFLAKREVEGWPVFGMLARLQGTVFVNRQRKRSIPATNAGLAAAMKAGNAVVLFAEATTSDGTRVKRFHSSHFAAASNLMAMDPDLESVVVQPVGISCTRRDGLPLGRQGRAELAWYGDMTLLPHVWKLLAGGPVDCKVIFAPVIAYRRGGDRKIIARLSEIAVREAVSGMSSGQLLSNPAGEAAKQSMVSILLKTKTA